MNLNKVYLIGRLASDPEFRTTPSGQEVATLRMATNRVWKDHSSGEKREATEFHSVVVWGRLAQIANQYLNKGAMAMIEGRLQTRSWEGQDGVKRYRTEIVAESLQLGPKPSFKSEGKPSFAKEEAAPPQIHKEEIPIINEDQPFDKLSAEGPAAAESDIEEAEVQLKDVPF
ncbi:MAG: single-stranded DNA-binding protein [Candidatus Yanofskybacteria bacterium]|nr:single-stranded DNA-binding protein [Candidatus Yanofskybacteria bacterium]